MCGSTFTLGPSRFDRRNAEKSPYFVSLSPFSPSLSDSPLSPLFALLFIFPFLLFSFFLYPLALPSLVCSILISFHFFPISLFSFSPLSFFFLFLFFLHFLFWITTIRMDQVGETSPHFPPWPLVITMFFFLIFLFSLSLLLYHVTHGLI